MATANQDPCVILEWDTAFFGFTVARVCGDVLTRELVRRTDAWCWQARVRCLYFLARADDAATTRLAEDSGFRLVDIRMTFECEPPGAFEGSTGRTDCAAVVRSARPEDVGVLKRIARESYRSTRFFFDANFPRHLCRLLYEKWIELSCEGYADAVLVAALDDVPVGYISCHLDGDSRTSRIGLLGVSRGAQGRGIGHELVLSALEWLSTQGAERVLVVTQGRNCAAQRLYQGCGFVTQTIQLWYHKWYPSSEVACE